MSLHSLIYFVCCCAWQAEIDLSSLTRETPYEVRTPEYTYELNICKAVPCKTPDNHEPAGACQVSDRPDKQATKQMSNYTG